MFFNCVYEFFLDESIENTTYLDDDVKKLEKAIQDNDKEQIKVLMEKETNLKALSTKLYQGFTLLHFAVQYSKITVSTVTLLVQKIDISQHLDVEKLNPLHYASKLKNHEKLKTLLETHPNSVNSQCSIKKTPLHYAVENNCFKNIDILLKTDGVDVKSTDIESKNILHYIVSKNEKAVGKYKKTFKNILHHTSFEESALLPPKDCETNTKSVIDCAVDKGYMCVLLEISNSK